MNRRAFIAGLVAGVAWSLAAHSQSPGRVYRLGCLFSAPRDAPHQIALFDELSRLGFVEGLNVTIDSYGYGLRTEQFDDHAASLVKTSVDVILAGGDAAVRAAQRLTTEIPILALTDDMVGQGFVRSLAQPGDNTTGVTILASELDGKRQEILVEAFTEVRHIAALVDSNIAVLSRIQELKEEARARGVDLSTYRVVNQEQIAAAVDAAKVSGAGALNVLASALFFNNRAIIFDRTAVLRLPAIYQWPEMAEQGGLIGYGPRIVQLYRDVQSRQLVSLLRGTKPSEIPVEQPSNFELAINLKTAKALGFEIPPSLLARANEVIE